jgi:uncharacterized protein HemY
MWFGIIYLVGAVITVVAVSAAFIIHENNDFGYGSDPDVEDYAMGITVGACAAMIWPLVAVLIGCGYIVRRVIRSYRDMEKWTKEAKTMTPQQRQAYEAAWREVDEQEVS